MHLHQQNPFKDVYVVVWQIDLDRFEDRPTSVYTLDEWAQIPYYVRKMSRAKCYKTKDRLAAYTQALKEQTNDRA